MKPLFPGQRPNFDKDAWVFECFFGKDRFPIREQYSTYDFQNLLADFGGYLGLLLGYSLLGFYDIVTELIEQVFDKCNRDQPYEEKLKKMDKS